MLGILASSLVATNLSATVLRAITADTQGDDYDVWADLPSVLQPVCAPVDASSSAECAVIDTPEAFFELQGFSLLGSEPGDYRVDFWIRGVPSEIGLTIDWARLSLGYDREFFTSGNWEQGQGWEQAGLACTDQSSVFEPEVSQVLDCRPPGSPAPFSGDLHLGSITFTQKAEFPLVSRGAGMVGLDLTILAVRAYRDATVTIPRRTYQPEPRFVTERRALLVAAETQHSRLEHFVLQKDVFPDGWGWINGPFHNAISINIIDGNLCGVPVSGYLDRASMATTTFDTDASDLRGYAEMLLLFRPGEAALFYDRLTSACRREMNIQPRIADPPVGDSSMGFVDDQNSGLSEQFVVILHDDYVILLLNHAMDPSNLDAQSTYRYAGLAVERLRNRS